jgi:hypothetical protein
MALLTLDTFDNTVIAHYHREALDRYLKLKAIGQSSRAALSGAFGFEYASVMNQQYYIDLIESSDAYTSALPKYVATLKHHAVWSPEISARTLAAIATDQSLKSSDRIAAAKELNVIFNITVVDENGKTKAGRSLADFYSDVRAMQEPRKDH